MKRTSRDCECANYCDCVSKHTNYTGQDHSGKNITFGLFYINRISIKIFLCKELPQEKELRRGAQA